MREKTLAEGLVEGVIAVILSRWSRRSDLIRPMYSHSPCCRASRIDTARSAIQYRDSENKTQSEIFEGQGARLLIFRLSEVSGTPLTSPRLPQVRSQFQNAGRAGPHVRIPISIYVDTGSHSPIEFSPPWNSSNLPVRAAQFI